MTTLILSFLSGFKCHLFLFDRTQPWMLQSQKSHQETITVTQCFMFNRTSWSEFSLVPPRRPINLVLDLLWPFKAKRLGQGGVIRCAEWVSQVCCVGYVGHRSSAQIGIDFTKAKSGKHHNTKSLQAADCQHSFAYQDAGSKRNIIT